MFKFFISEFEKFRNKNLFFKFQRGSVLIFVVLIIIGILMIGGWFYLAQKKIMPTIHPEPTIPEPSIPTVHRDYKQTISLKIDLAAEEEKIEKEEGELSLSYFFNKDNKDNIYISDLTGRVRAFDSAGNLLLSFYPKFASSGGIHDLVIDEKGNIYITNGPELFQYNSKGILQKEINIEKNIIGKAGKGVYFEMYLVGNKIYQPDVDQFSYLVGIIKDGFLEETEFSKFEGVLGSISGNRYKVSLSERWKRGELTILDSTGAVLKTIDLEIEGIVSIRFLGEDQDGNIYIQIERTEGSTLFLEVHKFDSAGNRLTILNIPEMEYIHWTNRLLLVGRDGAIWQVRLTRQGWYINKWNVGIFIEETIENEDTEEAD